jgi:hypothetical protein
MNISAWSASLVLPLLLAAVANAQPPITTIQDAKPKPTVFDASRWDKPLLIKSQQDAAKHFAGDDLARLNKQVDFEKQFVLLFAWKGSGQDRLDVAVAESYPEQIMFKFKPGRTRDLREHIHVYALRSNVKWSVR